MPTNLDLLFGVFVLFFYGYGTVLHWGFEFEFLSAHQSIINGSYEQCVYAPEFASFIFAAMGMPLRTSRHLQLLPPRVRPNGQGCELRLLLQGTLRFLRECAPH